MNDYTKVIAVNDCLKCWPHLCRCKCPHDVWMNLECQECGRKYEPEQQPDSK